MKTILIGTLWSGECGCGRHGCDTADRTPSQKDANRNGIPCDIVIRLDPIRQGTYILSDGNVDEDPDDEAYALESIHRSFVLAIGKLGVVFLIGVFVRCSATGLIRNEMTSGTIISCSPNPLPAASVSLPFAWGLCASVGLPHALIALLAIVSGLMGPSDGFFRFGDLGVWMSVWLASVMAITVYGMLFAPWA